MAVNAAPQLEVNETKVDFGRFQANQEQSASVEIKNVGDELLRISDIKSSCGCAVGVVSDDTLEPGETTSVEVKILPESISGPFSKVLFIRSNDLDSALTSVMVKGHSVPLLAVKPQNMIYAGTLQTGEVWRQEFLLEASCVIEWGDVEVSGSEEHDVEYELVAVEDTENQYLFSVEVTPATSENQLRLTLLLPIKSPENWRPVELLIHGRVVGENPGK